MQQEIMVWNVHREEWISKNRKKARKPPTKGEWETAENVQNDIVIPMSNHEANDNALFSL